MSAEARSAIPTSPDVLKTLIVPDAYWINTHSSEMLDRWNMWLQQ